MVLTINIFLQKNNLILATTNNNQVITLGLAYDPSGVYINAYRGYQFYIQKINSMGGISLGLPGHKTNYTFELIAHSIINTTDPYWEQTSKFEYSFCYYNILPCM